MSMAGSRLLYCVEVYLVGLAERSETHPRMRSESRGGFAFAQPTYMLLHSLAPATCDNDWRTSACRWATDCATFFARADVAAPIFQEHDHREPERNAMISRRRLLCTTAAAAGVVIVGEASAQAYPNRPIKMIVPFPPGGPIDVSARLVGDRLAAEIGQSVVIENRPGAGASIGSKAAAAAEPDGYTLLFGSSGSLAVTPALVKNAGYDPVKSFAPVAAVSSGALVLAINPSVPAKTVKELVAYAKTNPGKLNYGSGLGTPPHVAWGLFKLQTGADILYVPYQGAAGAITDLLAGRMHMIIDAPGVLLAHIRDNKLSALAVTSPGRSADLPDVPTMAESGYPDFLMTFWTGVVAPAGTPGPIVSRLNAAINAGLRSAEMKARLAQFQVEPKPGSPEDFAAFIASEAQKWATVIRSAGIKVE